MFGDFLQAFYFSCQTLTTVGFGGVSPRDHVTGFISSFEAFVGLASTALLTGLVYGRFSRSRPGLVFSDKMILSTLGGKRNLSFRVANARRSALMDLSAWLAITFVEKGGDAKSDGHYFNLNLDQDQLVSLPLSWMLVHPIDAHSPLCDYTDEEIMRMEGEIFVTLRFFDDAFSQNLFQRHSYLMNDLVSDMAFVPDYYFDERGQLVLDFAKLSQMVPLRAAQ